MEQRISVLTIAADNLNAMKKFYSDVLGWEVLTENRDIVFYKLNGFLLSICDARTLADFIGVRHQGSASSRVTIGYNVGSKEQVLRLYESLKEKVQILKEPVEPPFGGLFFYFADTEGNILEVACNPYITLDLSGNVVEHKPIDHL